MATEGEKHKRLFTFLQESFRPLELERFLRFNGYAEVAGAVNQDAAGADYFFRLFSKVCG
jgi:hypothetical protein